jgi:hypothetical protein
LPEIRRFFFFGDPLDGVVPEPAASAQDAAHALFGAQNSVIIQFYAINTMGAGMFDLFPK